MPLPRFDGSVLDNTPRPVPGASISVLTQPTTSLTPPGTPLASIFSDVDGTIPLANPFNADGSGNYFFYVAAGTYTIIIYGGSLASPIVLPDQSLFTSVGGGVTLQTNGTPNSSQVLFNLAAGSNITLAESGGTVTVTGSAVAITLQTNGTNNGSQALLNLIAGSGITVTNSGGGVTLASTAGAEFQVNGTPAVDQALINLTAGKGVTITDNGTGTLTFDALPVYAFDGTPLASAKIVQGEATLSGGLATVTLTGAAVFSNTSYRVISNLPVTIISASQFQINGVDTPAAVFGLNVTSNVLTVTCNQLFVSGQSVVFSSVTGATFLNAQTVNINTASAVGANFQFTAPFTHADYGKNATISNVALTTNVVTITTSATHTFATGSLVAISGVTTATFLNGLTLTITGTTGTTFTAALTHANYASAADTGTVADADTGFVGITLSGNVPWIAIGA